MEKKPWAKACAAASCCPSRAPRISVEFSMSKASVIRVVRPQGLAVVMGMGALSVATVGLFVAYVSGASIDPAVQVTAAVIGMLGGARAVLYAD